MKTLFKTILMYNLAFTIYNCQAQNIGINGTGATAHPSALLDLNARPLNNTGFLMPRMSTTERYAIASPALGLQVFDTVLLGYYTWYGTKWDCLNNPAGTVQHFANVTAPIGYLICNGQSVSTTTYPELFNAIGYTYGGSGSSFNVPDLRGEFIRGAALTGTVDAGRVLGSLQLDSFKSHNHSDNSIINVLGQGYSMNIITGYSGNWYTHSGSGVHNTSNTGDTETRPRNLALLPCIKY